MKPVLMVIPGGRNQPEVVSIERRDLDELHMEIVARNAESLQLVRRIGSHARAALFALARLQPDERMAEHHLSQIYRLAIQEQLRATAQRPAPDGSAAVAPVPELMEGVA